ncbi:hypothetical protein ACLB2K_028930 [Fragaria x ananassa]
MLLRSDLRTGLTPLLLLRSLSLSQPPPPEASRLTSAATVIRRIPSTATRTSSASGGGRLGVSRISCCCSDLVVPIRSNASSEGKRKKCDEWRFDSKKERGFATHLSRHRHPPHPLHRHKDELSKRRRLTVDGGRLGVSRINCCCSDLVVLIRSNASSEGKRKKCDEWRFDSKNQRPHKAGLKAAAALPFTSAQVRRDVLLCDIHTDSHKQWGRNRSNFACWGMC